VRCQELVRRYQAARWYSWMSPPSTSIRSIDPVRSVTSSVTREPRDRCHGEVVRGCSGRRRPSAPARDGDGSRSGSSPGTRPECCAPSAGIGVGPRSPHRRLRDPYADSREHGVETGHELGIPITHEERDPGGALTQGHGEVAGLLGHRSFMKLTISLYASPSGRRILSRSPSRRYPSRRHELAQYLGSL